MLPVRVSMAGPVAVTLPDPEMAPEKVVLSPVARLTVKAPPLPSVTSPAPDNGPTDAALPARSNVALRATVTGDVEGIAATTDPTAGYPPRMAPAHWLAIQA